MNYKAFLSLMILFTLFSIIFCLNCKSNETRVNLLDPEADEKYRIVNQSAPTDKSEILIVEPSFDWTTVEQAKGYELQISIAPFFNFDYEENGTPINPVPKTDAEIKVLNAKNEIVTADQYKMILTTSTYTPTTGLPYNKYYWRVRPISNEDVSGNWSEEAYGWSFTIAHSSLPIPKKAAAIAATDNGEYIAVIAGLDKSKGKDITGPATFSANLYSKNNNVWTSMQGLGEPDRAYLTAEYYKEYIYLIGGKDDTFAALQTLLRMKMNGSKWESLENMNGKRGKHSSVVYKDKIYVFGGDNNLAALADCEEYDITKNEWANIPDMPGKRFGTDATVFKDKIWVIGGRNYDGAFTEIYIYDPVNKTWGTHPQGLPSPRAYVAATVHDNLVWIIGGSKHDDDDLVTTENVILCNESTCWAHSLPIPENKERSAMQAFTIDDQVWCVGGETSDMLIYDKNAINPNNGEKGWWMP